MAPIWQTGTSAPPSAFSEKSRPDMLTLSISANGTELANLDRRLPVSFL
jgi:hypothetical protein